MRQFSEEELQEISLRFKGVEEYQKKIEAHKEEVKLFTSGQRETFKALAEKLDVKQKILKKAFKQYMEAKTNPEEHSELEDILAMMEVQLPK